MHGSDELDDAALLDGFERHTLPREAWTHRAHVRVAMLHVRRLGFDAALERMRARIQAFNHAKGITDSLTTGYHETLTVAWLRVVAAAVAAAAAEPPADSIEFCDRNPDLLDKTLLRRYYTRERMLTEDAKRAFVEPDLEPLPEPSGRRGSRAGGWQKIVAPRDSPGGSP